MADATVSWSRNSTVFSVDPNEKLFVFGYSCKIFRDDEKAKYIDQGKHLIPWMGDKTLMIDRYDVRGYLHDLKQYEPKGEDSPEGSSAEEEEVQCDRERYRSLRTDMSEEQLYHEEELKRLRAAIAGDHHEIAFTYDTAENQKYQEQEETKAEEPEDELFQLPPGLTVPKDMELPHTMKIHAIIEKTAAFVSQQGGQMEIIIKMKQNNNPQFAFMHLDNPLHPYYRHLVREIKGATYKLPTRTKRVSQSEEEEDGHYLHPSLMAGRAEPVPKFTVPAINFRRSSDDSYSVLVRNLQQHFVETPPEDTSPPNEEIAGVHEKSVLMSSPSSGDSPPGGESSDRGIVTPPPDFQPVVDKMAEYVAKNGDDFEILVKSRKDNRFDFLHSWHEFYAYYIHKREAAKGSSAQQCPDPPARSSSGTPTHTTNALLVAMQNAEDIIKKEESYLYGDSMDASPKEEDPKGGRKTTRALKGPISFSLKSRDIETPTDNTSVTALLLDDDSEGDSGREDSKGRLKGGLKEKREQNAAEVKAPKQVNEFLEAKHAEERVRDKLVAAARERLAQQRREKQLQLEKAKREEQLKKDKQQLIEKERRERGLQLERKRKAALFLRMLEKKGETNSTAVVSHILGTKKRLLHRQPAGQQPIPGIKSDWSSGDSASEQSGEEEPISVIGSALTSSSEGDGPEQPVVQQQPSNSIEGEGSKLSPARSSSSDSKGSHTHRKKRKKSHKKHKKTSRRNKSTEKEKKKEEEEPRSKSPPSRYREEVWAESFAPPPQRHREERELPAAYALNKRSRSRSRSPPGGFRYHRSRPFDHHWNRRR